MQRLYNIYPQQEEVKAIDQSKGKIKNFINY